MSQQRWPGIIGPVALLVALESLTAQEPSAADSRLDALNKRASILAIAYPDQPQRMAPQLLKTPVLRCNDPTRDEMDGALWLWVEGQRPVAGLCILLYANGKWNYEHIALADESVAVTGRPGWSWQPAAAARTWSRLDAAVPTSPRARQTAMRSIARKLEASEVRRGETYPLRLLDRPIYTYADEKQGIIDGALFALSYGTNPEVLAQIEARLIDDKPAWHVTFARMSAAEITVKLDGKELWAVEAMKADDPTGSYYGVNELPMVEQ
jgi:hypothetical protein